MNLPLAVAVVCLALLGTAEARLGETLEECEKEYGKLNDPDGKFTMADPNKYFPKTTNEEISGLRLPLYLVFRKTDNICVFVGVCEFYETSENSRISFQIAQKIIAKNIPNNAGKLAIGYSEGLENGVPSSNKWAVRWGGQDEGIEAIAQCGKKTKKGGREMFAESVHLYTSEFGTHMIEWNEHRLEEILHR